MKTVILILAVLVSTVGFGQEYEGFEGNEPGSAMLSVRKLALAFKKQDPSIFEKRGFIKIEEGKWVNKECNETIFMDENGLQLLFFDVYVKTSRKWKTNKVGILLDQIWKRWWWKDLTMDFGPDGTAVCTTAKVAGRTVALISTLDGCQLSVVKDEKDIIPCRIDLQVE